MGLNGKVSEKSGSLSLLIEKRILSN